MTILEWILFYFIPATLVFLFATRQQSLKTRSIIIHIGLILSIILLTAVGTRLRWEYQTIPFLCLLGTVILAIYLLSKIGIAYAISSAIQESCLLLAAVLLMHQIGFLWAAVLSALVYAAVHLIELTGWQSKFFIALFWGVCSALLYFWIHQPMFNFAIHILGGSILIKNGVLYRHSEG